MQVIPENSKNMVNRANDSSEVVGMNGQKLEEMTSFKYLGATLFKDDTC